MTKQEIDVRRVRQMKWVKGQWLRMPHKGKKRRKLLEFIMRLTPNSRSTYHLKRYKAEVLGQDTINLDI